MVLGGLMLYYFFLENKIIANIDNGFEISTEGINPLIYDFQNAIVKWAIRKGRAAVFADCGLGKTPIQLEWAKYVYNKINQNIIIFAPLAVNQQTVEEGDKFNIDVNICREQSDVVPGINIANYEIMHKFNHDCFGGIVLDESSILKSYGGIYRKDLTEFAKNIKYKLCCTATPAPNDLVELINHAEFLDVMRGKEMIALYFTQDGNTTHKWRLKKHAQKDFWKWMATWSVALRKPEDIGYSHSGFDLPDLNIVKCITESEAAEGHLFAVEATGLKEQRLAQKASLNHRLQKTIQIINNSQDQWLIWCNYNYESDSLKKNIPGSVEIKGADPTSHKEKSMMDFKHSKIRVLVTKPSIAGFGMNFQQCHNIIFVGLSHSYEQYYQALRRCWRYGQKHAVNIYIVISEAERNILNNVLDKEKRVSGMMDNIISQMGGLQMDGTKRQEMKYEEQEINNGDYRMILGDAIEKIDEIEDNSIGLSVFSPPFPGMYAYTNSMRDVGNCTKIDEMINHFRYLVTKDKLYRVIKPGRMAAIHLCQLTAMLSRDGYIGLKDYRGRVIQMMIDEGWVYAGEVTIDKNPQLQAVRNKERGLLFKTLANDSSKLRMGLADYLIYFRKPGESIEPIRAGISEKYNPDGSGWITENEWIEWAAPVWYRQSKDYPGGIRETDVLNVRAARSADDERHLCPLQLGVIHRAVYLWSNPGDIVLSPFAGMGSEGYQALLDHRRFIGIELKKEYYETALNNLQYALHKRQNDNLQLFEESS